MHYDYIENNYDSKSKLLFTDTDSLMHEIIKLKMSMKILAAIKKCIILVTFYLRKSKHYDLSNKLVIGKMKDETGGCWDWRICQI